MCVCVCVCVRVRTRVCVCSKKTKIKAAKFDQNMKNIENLEVAHGRYFFDKKSLNKKWQLGIIKVVWNTCEMVYKD